MRALRCLAVGVCALLVGACANAKPKPSPSPTAAPQPDVASTDDAGDSEWDPDGAIDRALALEDAGQIEAAIDSSLAPRVHCRYNPDFREGSSVSLWTMREDLRAGMDVLLMDADVLYAPAILERLLLSPIPNCFLLDRDFEAGEEPMKICVDAAGRMVEFRKHIAADLEYNLMGESVGFFRFTPDRAARIANRAEEYVAAGKRGEHYEEILRDELLAEPDAFGYEDITGSPWIEIDFPADVERARNEILVEVDGS